MLWYLVIQLTVITPILAQGWAVNLDGVGDDQVTGLATDSQGSVYAVGYFTSSSLVIYDPVGQPAATLINDGSFDGFIVKYAANGTFIWAARFGGASDDYAFAIAIDSEDNIMISGQYRSAPVTFYNAQGRNVSTQLNGQVFQFVAFVTKYSSAGQFIWIARQDGLNSESASGVTVDKNNNIIVVGSYFSNPMYVYDAQGVNAKSLSNNVGGYDAGFVVKYSTNGSFIWAARQDGLVQDRVYDVSADSSGNCYMVGQYFSNPMVIYDSLGKNVSSLQNSGQSAGFIVKYFSNGSFAWAARQHGSGYDQNNAVAVDKFANCYIAGYSSSAPLIIYDQSGAGVASLPSSGSYQGFVIKYLGNGSYASSMRLDGTGDDGALAVTTDGLGNVIVSGYYSSNQFTIYGSNGVAQGQLVNSDHVGGFAVKFSTNGSFIWATRQDSNGSDFVDSVATDPDGNVYIGGYFQSTLLAIYDGPGVAFANLSNSGGTGDFVVKYNSDGSFSSAGVVNAVSSESSTFNIQPSSTQSVTKVAQSLSASTMQHDTNLVFDLFTKSLQLLVTSTLSVPITQNNQDSVSPVPFWIWIAVGAGAIILLAQSLLICYCVVNRKQKKAQHKMVESSTIHGGTTMLDQTIPFSNGTTMLNQTIPLGDEKGTTTITARTSSSTTQVRGLESPQYQSFTQVVPADQGNEPYLSASD